MAQQHRTDNKPAQANSEQSNDTPSPVDVAEEFGRDYYSCLSTNPKEIGKYYKDDSVFTVLTEGSQDSIQERITGPRDIQERLQASGLGSYRVRLPVFQAQESINGSVLILAKGTFVKKGDPGRNFVQTFLLAPQHPSGWYVKNDVLIFLPETQAATASGNAAQASHQQTSSNTSSTSAPSAATTAPATSQTSSAQQASPAHTEAPRKDATPASGAAQAQTSTSSAGAPRSGSGATATHQAASNVNANSPTTTANDRHDRPFGRPQGNQNARQQQSPSQQTSQQQDNSSQQGGRRNTGFGRSNKGKEKDESELAPGEKPKNSWASIVASTGTGPMSPPGTDLSPTSQFRSPNATPKSPQESVTVRVRNLPYEASEQAVRDTFKQFGDVARVKMNRGWCFVEFSTSSAVKDAVSAQELKIDGRPLQVEEKAVKQVRRGVRADGKRVGMGDQNRPRNAGGRGDRGKGQPKKDH